LTHETINHIITTLKREFFSKNSNKEALLNSGDCEEENQALVETVTIDAAR
jgi:hypothetical protein